MNPHLYCKLLQISNILLHWWNSCQEVKFYYVQICVILLFLIRVILAKTFSMVFWYIHRHTYTHVYLHLIYIYIYIAISQKQDQQNIYTIKWKQCALPAIITLAIMFINIYNIYHMYNTHVIYIMIFIHASCIYIYIYICMGGTKHVYVDIYIYTYMNIYAYI